MSRLSGIFHSRDKPQNRTAGSAYAFFMGGSTAGKAVNERTAMQMTAVYSCVRILAEAIAGLPLHLYQYAEDGSKAKAIEHPLYRLLHDEPNPEMSSFVFRETLMTHLLLWGNAYAQVIRNGKGEVVALYPLMPNKMTVDRDSSGKLVYKYQRSNDEAPTMEGSSVILQPADVLHIPGLGFDGLVGYSPIAMAKNAIGLAIATEEYGAKLFANGAAPSGVLEHPGTVKDPSRVRASACTGVPLYADTEEGAWKGLFLDVGLMNFACGVDWRMMERLDDVRFVNEGAMAEQYVGQQLLVRNGSMERPMLAYWLREGGKNNAEVDFVFSEGTEIVPVEVKAGAAGSLKSLRELVLARGFKSAIRFDMNPASTQVVRIVRGNDVTEYTLRSLPLYAAAFVSGEGLDGSSGTGE